MVSSKQQNGINLNPTNVDRLDCNVWPPEKSLIGRYFLTFGNRYHDQNGDNQQRNNNLQYCSFKLIESGLCNPERNYAYSGFYILFSGELQKKNTSTKLKVQSIHRTYYLRWSNLGGPL